jgi:AcrR family transcriptional regulator
MPEPKPCDRGDWHSAGNPQQTAPLQPGPGRPVAIDHVGSLVGPKDARILRQMASGLPSHRSRAPPPTQGSVRFVQRDQGTALSGCDSSCEPTQPAADHGHFFHISNTIPYGTLQSVPTRSDWIQTGLAAVADNGPDGLRIDRLCRRLGVSKGSFHHHFAGAGDFKQALLAEYEVLVVEALNQAIEQTAADNPKAALANLTAAITGPESFYRPDLEVAMRAWAFADSEVRTVQERVDKRRLESLQGIWSSVLDDPAAIQTAALLPYLVGIGASLVQPPTPPDQLRNVYELLLDLVPDVDQPEAAGKA